MQTVHSFRRKKKLGSYPYVTVIFSITLALLVIGLCGLFILYAGKLSASIRNNIEIQIYLDRYITEEEIIQLTQTIRSRRYLQSVNGQPQIRFVSKEEAAKNFARETGENFIALLGENPLRDAFVIKIKPEFYEARSMRQIKADLEKINGVFEATYVENLIESINRNIVRITFILIGFATILLLTVSILINNTIKLAMFSQRFLIRSMQLVGATNFFIQRPFIIRAAFQGLAGGILASGLLWLLVQYAQQQVPELLTLMDIPLMLILFAALSALGILVGLSSSYRSVNRYLHMSLDELY